MRKKAFLVALALAAALLGLVLLACNPGRAMLPADDWSTDNEEPVPGDWDTVTLIDDPGSYVERSAVYAYEGDYSYKHYPTGVADLQAHTRINCTVPITQGVMDARVLFVADPGHGGQDEYMFLAAGWYAANTYSDGWYIDWNFYTKRAQLFCRACYPDRKWWLGTIRHDEWHHYRIEWNLPPAPGTGSIQVWMDDDLWLDQSGLPMEPGGSYDQITSAGAGPVGWHGVWADGWPIYVDDIQIYPCDEPWPDPTPTPVPSVATCDQYGHAAVLNVDDDCSAVLRFRAIPNYVPHDAVVTRATLHLYGISVEQVGATINIAPLVPVWGEMTCDWCRRTVGEEWADPGATNVPLDRFPGNVAEFTAELGWVEVDIPAYIIEEWALSSAANPGLVLSNDELTGKYGIASREWIDADYRPYMVIYYPE